MNKHRKIISVVGASSGCGATYISTRLALEMGSCQGKVTFLEDYTCDCPSCQRRPLVYYEMGLYEKRRFNDFFFEKATGTCINNKVNALRGVNWVVRTPSSPLCVIEPDDVVGEYIIWDSYRDFYKSDLILCILNPEKRHMMAGLETVKYCRDNFSGKTFFVFNQVTSQATVKAAETLLGIKADFCLNDAKEDNKQVFSEISRYILTLF